MKTRAKEELFEKWNSLGDQIKIMSNIAQNDMETSQEEINRWFKHTNRLETELNLLLFKIATYYGFEDKR